MGSERRDSGRPAQQGRPDIHVTPSSSNRIREQRKKEKKRKKKEKGDIPISLRDFRDSIITQHVTPSTEIHLALFCIYELHPHRSLFGSIQQQKPSLHKFLLGGRNIIISFRSSLNICHSGVIRFLATSPRGLLLLSASTYNTSLSLL